MNLGLNVNVKVIAERLGNTVEMVYKIYGHLLAELEVESVSLFNQNLPVNADNFGGRELVKLLKKYYEVQEDL